MDLLGLTRLVAFVLRLLGSLKRFWELVINKSTISNSLFWLSLFSTVIVMTGLFLIGLAFIVYVLT